MILPNDTIVAVADGNRMRLFRNKGAEPHIRLVGLDEPEIDAANQGSGARHRNSSANPDAGRLAEDDFAAAAAAHLNRLALQGEAGPFYIVADPRTLGEMRRHLHDAVRTRLAGELAKDLTGHPIEAIAATIAKG